MIAYDVEDEFVAFRRTADRLGASANAEPGAFVTFLPPNERSRRRSRRVEIKQGKFSFTISVPYDLGRELRTVVDGSSDLVKNLAKCFERAYMATMSKDVFLALHQDKACGTYEDHQRSIQREGYESVACDLVRGLGKDNYESLMEALRTDLGVDNLTPVGQKRVVEDCVDSRAALVPVAGQPLALFPT